MSGPGHGGDVAPAGATDALRLAVLDAAEGLGEADVLRLAVQQCVAALGGLGGLAHLAGREHDTLRLAAAGGVPDPVARAWERVDDHRLAPVRAMDRRQVQWSPRWPDDPHHAAPGHPGTARAEPGGSEAGGSEAGGSGAGGRRPDGVPPGLRACGLLSAPILVDGSPVGVLSVLAEREPAPDRRRFLAEVAALVGVRLPVARRWRSGTTPWWQEPQGVGGQVMRQISVGTWSWDLDTGLLDIDEVTEGMVELAGLDPDAWDHRIESWMERIHPDDRPGVQEAIEESLTYGRPYAVEHRVLDDAGRVNWLELRAAIERDDSGRPVRMVGTVWNITARRSQLEWLAGLLELNPDPIFVVAADNRVQWANRAARQLGGGGDVTGRTPWETEPLLRERGLPELLDRARAAPGSSATLEVDVEHPAPRGTASYLVKAVEIGGFMSIQMSDTTERRRAEQAAAERGRQVADLNAALVRALNTQDVVAAVVQHVLPLVHADGLVVHDLTGSVPRLIGDIGFSPALVEELHALQLRQSARQQPAEGAEAGTEAGAEAGTEAGAAAEAGAETGAEADAGAEAEAGAGAEHAGYWGGAQGAADLGLGGAVGAEGVTDQPRFISRADRFTGATTDREERPGTPSWLLNRLAELDGVGAWAVLPLAVGDRRVGSCVIGWSAPRRFTEDDKTLLGTVGVIIAQALGNARLYESARHRAERLQQELLPGRLPDTVGLRAVARYRTADGQELGGDWYDTIALSGGRTLAVIGDVMGHGLEQAIAMGIIRHAALTVAALDMPVDEIMAHLNDVVVRLAPRVDDPVVCATCLLALYDPTSGACSIASAGHAPPIALEPGGTAHRLTIPSGPPLGMAQVPAQVTETVFAEGTVLVLYTDGLLGSQAPDAERLTDAVARYAGTAPVPVGGERAEHWLATMCDAVVAQLPPDPCRQDDAVLLALSTGRVPANRMAAWDLPWAPESAGRARDLTAAELAAWHLDDLADTATLIVSELIGNTVRHAVGLVPDTEEAADGDSDEDADLGDLGDLSDLGLDSGLNLKIGLGLDDGPAAQDADAGFVRLRLLRIEHALICEVYDGSQATPRVRHPLLDDEFGRGLQLVAMMAGQWGTRYTESGKCIWASLDAPSPPDDDAPSPPDDDPPGATADADNGTGSAAGAGHAGRRTAGQPAAG
ncbi:SpoIIE family protein phosphatase [Streptomyces sp. NBC_00669]|uniref:SpoIIE family protein phosphatase n=1 Tax=Streptomyces sp. NBC_00669 TaxID=2976011 RepID=UPI002E34DFAC|nr:SpoIIE family protein phosphatase [Streptomyces sp. NBC_00669]